MDDALPRLFAWLSPAYPVGAFAYSHGLEAAVAAGEVHDVGTARDWISDCLTHGAGRNDAILLAEAWRGAEDARAVDDLARFARALAPSSERLLESEAQGRSFAETTAEAWSDPAALPAPYPVAFGAAAARAGAPLVTSATLYLQAWVSNLVSAAIRLVPLGQTDGQRIVADLTADCATIARDAAEAGIDQIGGCAILSDIASMRHETQTTRLFRT